ncbi:hypothetical protein [Dyadobacter arcticus]|uniref:Uncharacterized protein n=1 Tax=Dyadobacter arcticus TaxID=1078754 RepID=A0ABX0UGC5_9BACT|nr:hypothetical protein [Dyadobacter arcticus]NIJ52058.1 hypothetical protein [Dyadobacter arcticus]
MHFNFKIAVLSSAIAFIIFSCKEQEVAKTSIQPEIVKTEIIDFMGEKAIVTTDFPKELFNQSEEEFADYYNSLKENGNARETGEEGGLSYEELNAIIIPHLKKYPDLSWETDISEKDLRRIFKDFPEITTTEQVREKSEIISAFYETFLNVISFPK